MAKFVAAVATLVCMVVLSSAAIASPSWCQEDPIFTFDGGKTVQVTTGFSRMYLTPSTVVRYDLVVPPGQKVATALPPSEIPAVVHVHHSARQPARTATLTVRVTGAASDVESTDTHFDGSGFPITVTVAGGSPPVYYGSSTGITIRFTTK